MKIPKGSYKKRQFFSSKGLIFRDGALVVTCTWDMAHDSLVLNLIFSLTINKQTKKSSSNNIVVIWDTFFMGWGSLMWYFRWRKWWSETPHHSISYDIAPFVIEINEWLKINYNKKKIKGEDMFSVVYCLVRGIIAPIIYWCDDNYWCDDSSNDCDKRDLILREMLTTHIFQHIIFDWLKFTWVPPNLYGSYKIC